MTDSTRGAPLGTWLADLDDDRLVRLLRLRPDLTSPPPGSLAALAARAQSRQSVRPAVEQLDFLTLAVIDALLVLQADTAAVPLTKLHALIGDRAPRDAVADAVEALRDRALVWGEDSVRVAAETASALPWHPGQVISEDTTRPPDEVRALLDGLDDPQRDILERLVTGSPVGRTRDAAPGTPSDRPVQRLLAAGLLRQLDAETVILPRLVGQLLRGEPPGPLTLTPPRPELPVRPVADVDAAAAGAVVDLLREVELLLDILGAAPVPELRSGGLGVREVRRLTKVTGLDEPRLGLLLELSAGAGLISAGQPDPPPADGVAPFWAPTVAADRFVEATPAARWQLLASTWLTLPRRPSLIGRRGPDGKPIPALADVMPQSAVPLDRRLLLQTLAELPPGTAVPAPAASELLRWRRPRWAARLQDEPIADLLDEATALGIVGRGALSTPARALQAGDAEAAAAAMQQILPAPIDYFLVQADLTVVVPGPLDRELAERLAVVADVESAGAAMVYRVSEASIRRALDTGITASTLQAFFAKHSKTPVPQGLTYLVDDVARRHGRLRVGIASSFVRCEDPALLTEVMSAPVAEDLQLRLLAPTVAVSQAPLAELLAGLRAAGLAPAAEDATGTIVDLRGSRARVPTPPQRRTSRPAPVDDDKLRAIVAVLRKVASTPVGLTLDAASAMLALQEAVRDHTTVLIGYVDNAGVRSQRVVEPVSLRGGQLAAFDPAAGRVREFAVHRVSSVVPVEPD
ncbi:helicase C-terminal domain-containing protein [Mycobacterium sp. MYCO198283]|uniref:helicase-associated domain-containing protein n=1 Tax=Mycobacterium sp. MYCO198283 TaxID=2883505 RepID=UPI001E43B327|nr:helicase-associated domain-containing protein [Mycobacterium sp. MYCO198283]MCG5431158.1 helicase C-terminal domain-containing protein [Mycobacterium sp. MYCO198283]